MFSVATFVRAAGFAPKPIQVSYICAETHPGGRRNVEKGVSLRPSKPHRGGGEVLVVPVLQVVDVNTAADFGQCSVVDGGNFYFNVKVGHGDSPNNSRTFDSRS
jgi:hypothetical protein